MIGYMRNFVYKKNLAPFFCIIFMLLLFSTWKLSASPATWFDEGINVSIAQSLAQNGVYDLAVGQGRYVLMKQFLITTNYPVLLPVALSLKLFGMNLAAARVPMVIFLFLFALIAYALVKKMYSEPAALWSLALIVSFVPFYGNGKDVLGEVPGLFFLLAGLLALSYEWNWKRLIGAGFLFGLSIATKPFFLLLLPAIFIGELHAQSWNLLSAEFWKRIGALGSGAAIPIAGWFFTILPNASVSGIVTMMSYYSNSYASTDIGKLIISNAFRFVTETTPLHFLFLAALTAAAVLVRRKRGVRIAESEVILFAFILLNFLWYLKTPGWYRYFFPSHILLFLFFPQALMTLFNRKVVLAALGSLFIIQTGYLLANSNDPLYNSDEAIRFSNYAMENTESNAKILVVNGPSVAFLLNGRQISQYLQINPMLFFGDDKMIADNQAIYDYIIVNRPVENILMPNFKNNLSAGYALANEMGHFMLYRKK